MFFKKKRAAAGSSREYADHVPFRAVQMSSGAGIDLFTEEAARSMIRDGFVVYRTENHEVMRIKLA